MSINTLSASEKEDLVVSLATLVLADGQKDVTAENLESIVKKSNNKASAFFFTVFEKALNGKNVNDFLAGPSAGGGGGGGASSSPAKGGAASAAKVEEKEEEKEEEVVVESM